MLINPTTPRQKCLTRDRPTTQDAPVAPSNTKTPSERESKIAEQYRDGSSLRTLAVNFSVSVTTVKNILKRLGVEKRATTTQFTGKKSLTEEQEQDVVRRYLSGDPALRISRDYPVNVQTIHNTLRRYGVETRPDLAKHGLTEDQIPLVIESCRSGINMQDTANTFGVC